MPGGRRSGKGSGRGTSETGTSQAGPSEARVEADPTPSSLHEEDALLVGEAQSTLDEGSSTQRRKRGRAKGISIDYVGAKLPIVIKDGKPIGNHYNAFVTKLGIYTKDSSIVPLHVPRFDDLPPTVFDAVINILKNIWDIDDSLLTRAVIIAHMRKTWNDHRSSIFRRHYANEPSNTVKQHPPIGFNPTEWVKLCEVFASPVWKNHSEKNKANREKQLINHVSGRVSFAQIKHKHVKEKGTEPDRMELWKMTHIKLDGKGANKHTMEVTSRMEQLASQSTEGSCSVSQDEIFRQVLGPEKRGRVRGQGRGPTPTELFDPRPSRDVLIRMLDREHRLREELEQRVEQRVTEEVDRRVAEEVDRRVDQRVTSEVDRLMEGRMRGEMEQMRAQLQLQMQQMMQSFISQGNSSSSMHPPPPPTD